MKYFFDNIRNSFDFFLRTHFNFSRKNYSEETQDLKKVFTNEDQIALYNNLKQKYNVTLIEEGSCYNYKQNIYYLNFFDKYLSKRKCKTLNILDVGSKNWSYVKSEYIFFQSYTSDIHLDGIEIDAYRLCTNFYSRYEIAKFYTKNLKNTNYISGDFLSHNKKYDYILWFLPFVTEYPLLRWGLPYKYFQPEKMLNHAYNLLNDGGELIIINQGEEEYKIQQELNKSLLFKFEALGEIPDEFEVFKNKRFGCLIKKES